MAEKKLNIMELIRPGKAVFLFSSAAAYESETTEPALEMKKNPNPQPTPNWHIGGRRMMLPNRLSSARFQPPAINPANAIFMYN